MSGFPDDFGVVQQFHVPIAFSRGGRLQFDL
jgi:hypothetical protein